MSENLKNENPSTEVSLEQAVVEQPVSTSTKNSKTKGKSKGLLKKILLFALPSVAVVGIITFLLCGLLINDYSVDDSQFVEEIVVDGELDLSQIVITRKNLFGTEEIQVTEDMIVEMDEISTAGEKKMKIKVDDQIYTIIFYVKYQVEFVVNDEVISTQLVLSPSEIVLPENPDIEGFLFTQWNVEIPEVLTGNLRFEAVFVDLGANVPNLGSYTATYGDLLSSINLPSSQLYGKWEFVDKDATVGNVGRNTFAVVFRSDYAFLDGMESEVTIKVIQKEVEF